MAHIFISITQKMLDAASDALGITVAARAADKR